jgi:hypothetical protein
MTCFPLHLPSHVKPFWLLARQGGLTPGLYSEIFSLFVL